MTSQSADGDQAMQINDNTIADPEPPKTEPDDDQLHSRRDVDKTDQALQINEDMADDDSADDHSADDHSADD